MSHGYWHVICRSLGNIHSCRSLFKQAIAKNLDYPERLMAVWQSMEYEEGSVESLEQSIVRINKKSKLVARDWQVRLYQQRLWSCSPWFPNLLSWTIDCSRPTRSRRRKAATERSPSKGKFRNRHIKPTTYRLCIGQEKRTQTETEGIEKEPDHCGRAIIKEKEATWRRHGCGSRRYEESTNWSDDRPSNATSTSRQGQL